MAKKSLIGALVFGAALISGTNASAEGQFEKTEQVKPIPYSIISSSDIALKNSEPKIMATFEYQSHRQDKNKGETFRYNLWSDGSISQTDKQKVEFAQRWFYDVDGDGKFGEAEVNAINSGKLIYMHPEFNKIANEKVRKAFSSMKSSPLEDYTSTELSKTDKKSTEEEFRGILSHLPMIIEESYANAHKSPKKEEELEVDAKKDTTHPKRFAIVAEGFGGKGFGGAGIGASWEPVDCFGLTGVISAGLAKDTILSEETTPSSPRGIYGHVMTEQTGKRLLSVSLDFRAGKNLYLVMGGGLNYSNWIEKNTAETIGPDGEIRKSNQDFIPKSQFSGAIRGGLEVITKSGVGIGVIASYDLKTKQPSFGGRISFRRTQHRK